jgi:DNA polymerase-3 subunit alpha
MGKKDPVKMAEMRDKFVDGAVATSGMDPKAASILFDKIEKFAGYSFNASHSCAYSLIAFQSMWLKQHYPAEFYAASLSILDSDKLAGIVKEAAKEDIRVVGPDINISTDIFEPVQDSSGWKLYAPFNRVMGIGDKTGAAIVAARQAAGGRFASLDQFLELVPKRNCNIRHQGILREIGALDSILPAEEVRSGPEKQRALVSALPGLMDANVTVSRVVNSDTQTKNLLMTDIKHPIMGWKDPATLQWISEPCQRCSFADAPHVQPRMGRSPKAMIITDGPTYGEEAAQQMAEGLGSEYLRTALEVNGLSVSDFYFTTLVKSRKPKGVRNYTNEQLNACTPYLAREIEILQPQLIVALGTATIRHLVKGVKGNADELVGRIEQLPALDCTILLGMNPQQVYVNAEKQEALNGLFAEVARILSN